MSGEADSARVLDDSRSPRHDVLDRLLPAVYKELRAIAHKHLAQHGHADSLATTGLVHEAYLKLVDQSRADWRDRAHFFALSSVALRQVSDDRARARPTL
jgi:hypothetical protein